MSYDNLMGDINTCQTIKPKADKPKPQDVYFANSYEFAEAKQCGAIEQITTTPKKYPAWYQSEDGMVFDHTHQGLLTTHLKLIQTAPDWAEIKSRYWQPDEGGLYWFWNTEDDLIACYYTSIDKLDGKYNCRFERQKKNGGWASSFRYCHNLGIDKDRLLTMIKLS